MFSKINKIDIKTPLFCMSNGVSFILDHWYCLTSKSRYNPIILSFQNV